MWDLNLNADAIMIDWDAEENAKHQTAERCIRGWMDDSGTSTSSTIVNAAGAGDEDSNSTNGTHTAVNTFTFDIMKSRSSDQKNMFGASSSAGASPEAGNTSVMIYSSVSLKPDWLNLSFSESAEQSEVRISQQKQPAKKSRRGPRSRSSEYRGVTFYRRTGRWESHIWDCGKQVYLGGFDTAHSAARAYDRAAIKFRGADADINFNVADYQEDMPQMRNLGKEEFVHILRRQSNGFGRGSSGHRGTTLHKSGGWEARMGQLLGKKAYDVVALRCNGTDAGTNFEPSTYEGGLAFLANNDVSCRGLDLSLSIDSSSHAGKLNKVDPRFGYSTSAAIGRLSTSSNHPPMSRALTLHSGTYSPTAYEVQSMETPVTLSSPRMPNWGWQHPQGRGKTISGLPPFSGAASSGFSSSQPGRIVTFPKTTALPPKLSLSK